MCNKHLFPKLVVIHINKDVGAMQSLDINAEWRQQLTLHPTGCIMGRLLALRLPTLNRLAS